IIHRVMGTTDKDWSITRVNPKERVEQGLAQFKEGDYKAMNRATYTRTFYPNGDGDHESVRGLHNDVLGLPKEDLDTATKEAVDAA
ncbi:hypothetical protein DM02DRAFT_545857, partial [Periconia macrospinosa]